MMRAARAAAVLRPYLHRSPAASAARGQRVFRLQKSSVRSSHRTDCGAGIMGRRGRDYPI